MADIKNNPHYQNGYYQATTMIDHIENTTYGTVENALETKRQLVKDLTEQFGWDENTPEVAKTLGMIGALEATYKKIESEKPDNPLVDEDVIITASEIGLVITPEQTEEILKRYPEAQKKDPQATWNLVIEQLINDVNNENL